MKSEKENYQLCVGIDLGTTNTLVAIVDRFGVVKVLPNIDGDLLTPSAVSLASNPPVVGRLAKQDRFFNPDTFIERFKTYMARMTETGEPIVLITSADGTDFTAITLSAEVLLFIKKSAEQIEGCNFSKAVITHPAYFTEAARRATKEAGLIAGFEEVLLVEEPTAAATCYGLTKGRDATIAVMDFGGGTFDICILEVRSNGQVRVVAVDGDPECGGGNIDEILLQEVLKFLKQKGYELGPEKDRAEWFEVLDKCEEAKQLLARKDKAVISLRVGNERMSMEVTYDQLKELAAPVIETLRQCCYRVIEKAGIETSQIHKVLLVGGSTRLRFVPEIAKEIFRREPDYDTDPDLVVARGAAIIAATHFAKPDQRVLVEGRCYLASAVRQQPIAPRALCVAAVTKKEQGDMKEYNVPIIPVSSELPFQGLRNFSPIDPSSKEIQVKLYEGHDGELSDDCAALLEVNVPVQSTNEENNDDRIEFTIRMDAEGLVHIDVRDKLLNKPIPIEFKFCTGLSDMDIKKARKQLQDRHRDDDQDATAQPARK